MSAPVETLALSAIAIPEGRLRQPRARDVDALALSMRDEGMHEPIKVRPLKGVVPGEGRKTHVLIDGGTRLAAAVLLTWNGLDCAVHDVTAEQARLMEVESNLVRSDLTALGRAVFLAAHKRAYEAAHPQTKKGGDRRSKAAQSKRNDCALVYDTVYERPPEPGDEAASAELDRMARVFVEPGQSCVASPFDPAEAEGMEPFHVAAAARTGMSPRTVQDYASVAAKLNPLIERLWGLPIEDSLYELRLLSRQTWQEQERVVGLIEAGTADTVRAALRTDSTGSRPPVRDMDKLTQRGWAAIDEMDRETQRAFVASRAELFAKRLAKVDGYRVQRRTADGEWVDA